MQVLVVSRISRRASAETSGVGPDFTDGTGTGGVGIVRISGEGVERIARAILGSLPEPRTATQRHFRNAAGERIDNGLALYFPAPASFTGESVLELHGHGGPVVVGLVVDAAVELGARLAEPGEFARRAFLNGKLDLVQNNEVRQASVHVTQEGADIVREAYLLDRLLTASIIEARGAERFALVAEALEHGALKSFYQAIARSEQRHYTLFLDLAGRYIDQEVIDRRWDELLAIEADIVRKLPIRAALH